MRVTGEEEVWGGQTSGSSLPSPGLGAGFWDSVCPPDDSQMRPLPPPPARSSSFMFSFYLTCEPGFHHRRPNIPQTELIFFIPNPSLS